MKTETKNEVLFSRMKKLVATERLIGVEILELLYEIELRKAYAELKYDGLFTYCVRELGFSDAQAYQRIQAMRALKSIPELKPMIESGSLSVSSVSKVETHLRQEKKLGKDLPRETRLELFEAMRNCSSREVDAKLLEVKGEKPRVKLILELDEELEALWTEVKNRAAHRSKGSEAEVLKILAREWLSRNDPAREVRSRKILDSKNVSSTHTIVNVHGDSRQEIGARRKPISKRTSIPASLRREIFRRDQSKCANCGSLYALEIDHRNPVARGGKNTPENLRVLCRSCNQHSAIREFPWAKRIHASLIKAGSNVKSY